MRFQKGMNRDKGDKAEQTSWKLLQHPPYTQNGSYFPIHKTHLAPPYNLTILSDHVIIISNRSGDIPQMGLFNAAALDLETCKVKGQVIQTPYTQHIIVTGTE